MKVRMGNVKGKASGWSGEAFLRRWQLNLVPNDKKPGLAAKPWEWSKISLEGAWVTP